MQAEKRFMKKQDYLENIKGKRLCKFCSGYRSLMLSAALAAYALASPVNAYAAVVIMGGDEVEDIGSADTNGKTLYQSQTAEPETDDWTADGNKISDERLSDKTIEYDELGTFIHKYNTTVQNAKTQVNSTKNMYSTLKAELVSNMWDSVKDAKDAKSDGDNNAYNTYKSYEKAYRTAVKSYNDVVDSLNSYGTNKSFASIERSLTKAAQSLMITYNTLRLTEDSLQKTAEISEAMYKNTLLMQSAGSATESDAENALAQRDSAKASLSAVQSSKDEVYANLCIMLGIDENAGYTVAELPEPDVSYIESASLDTDTQTAVNNNSSVQSLRHQSSGETASSSAKEAQLSEAEANAVIEIKSLYSSMKEALKAYESAGLTNENTQKEWSLAKKKNSMGMLSRAEYLSAELNYLSGKAEYENAKISLISAVNNYKWYVQGIA